MNLESRLAAGSALADRPYEVVTRAAATGAAEKLTAALAIVTHENLSRARLMATAGHDLKQPLQVLSILLDLMQSSDASDVGKKRQRLAQDSIARMACSLDELALKSQVGHPFATTLRQTFPIAEILGAIEATWHQHAARRSVQLRVAPCSAYVVSDAVMLTTIIGNLVGNAIKFSAGRTVLVGCRRRRGELLIQVLDSGCGISERHRQSIFEAFYQTGESAEGMGLGLSIVHSTAAALSHPIDVMSKVGRGSVFSVTVPVAHAICSSPTGAQMQRDALCLAS
ncbi:MAG: HAMP domain-containing sensor histidine kinase [Rudaea sp.]